LVLKVKFIYRQQLDGWERAVGRSYAVVVLVSMEDILIN